MGYEFLIRIGLRAAPYLAIAALAFWLYHQGGVSERRAQALRDARADILVLEQQRERADRATLAAQVAAANRAEQSSQLEAKVRDYEQVLKNRVNAGCLLDDDDIKRLRDFD